MNKKKEGKSINSKPLKYTVLKKDYIYRELNPYFKHDRVRIKGSNNRIMITEKIIKIERK